MTKSPVKPALWGALGLLGLIVVLAAALATRNDAGCGVGAQPSPSAEKAIPAQLLPIYQQAESTYGVPWSVLAAINSIETDFGRNTSTSSAGAQGWMQFVPSTWERYGVDGNHDGKKDLRDPADAIPGAAKYLHASGAPGDLKKAVFAYNHANWYVSDVLALAKAYSQGGAIVSSGGGCDDAGGPIGDASVAAIYTAADRLGAMHVRYNYGGGHLTPARPSPGSDGPYDGLDCSSSIAWVLQHAGLKLATLTSGEFMSWGEPGSGRSVTLYTNPGHIIMSIRTGRGLRYFGTSEFGHPKAGTGPAWFDKAPGAGYLAGFVKRHPKGL